MYAHKVRPIAGKRYVHCFKELLELSSSPERSGIGGDEIMQVICRSTNRHPETRCCVCGQGFVIFWERESRTQRREALFEIQKTLCNHHRHNDGPIVHPQHDFAILQWDRPLAAAGEALLGHTHSMAM